MNIFLLTRILNLGNKGDLVKVKNGYARNFLIPNKKATYATKENIEYFRKKNILEKNKLKKIKKIAVLQSKKINKLSNIIIYEKSGENKKLFGSVKREKILKEIKKHGINIQRKNIKFPDGPLKKIGKYKIIIQLYKNINTYINVIVKNKY